jgi:MFS family permease
MPTTSTKPKAETEDTRRTTSENELPVEKSASWPHTVLYGLTILLSAFLLFQVELIMAKFLLPRFGGGPSVWSTSLLVFQILLLGGYAYAAAISARLRPRVQGLTHLILLALSAVVMSVAWARVHSPIFPGSSLALRGGEDPIWPIIFLLLSSVGVQCLLLSATSPLLQHWFSRQHQRAPYRLYALSNLGSMVGLLAYPLLVERVLTLTHQAWIWSAGYLLFALLAANVALLSMQTTPVAPARPRLVKAKKLKKAEAHPKILWLALAACSCIMLLATTNLICQQIAPIPLLWVLPLSLYLLSFIICFDHARWYRRGIFHPFFLVWTLFALRLLPNYTALPTSGLLVVYSIALFAVCMVCHGELARLKPAAEGLTSFYLLVSAGGAIGSAFVALLAPQIFDRFWEFQIGLVGCAILLGVSVFRDRSSWIYTMRRAAASFSPGPRS